jgi:WW domain-containing oxidoreductase
MPQIEAGAASKGVATIVAVSSVAHYDSYPEGIRMSIAAMNDEDMYDGYKAYGQSKLANVLFAQELAKKAKNKNILVNSVHPGQIVR